jgi:hypothetical protein
MPDLPLPLDFRSEFFESFTRQLRDGESVALLGVGSCGKSNVVRFLKRADAREFYFQHEAAKTLYTPLDCYKLDDYGDVTLYAAILAALAENASALPDADSALSAQWETWWQETLTQRSAPLARRRVEHALQQCLNTFAARVILLLDDCDDLVRRAPPALLRSLRALRDDHKYKLLYVTVTRRELAVLREPSPDYESFFELFEKHQLALQPYAPRDAEFMLKRLVLRHTGTRHFTAEETQNIYRVTGGHAGFLSATFEWVKNTDRAQSDTLEEFLTSKRVVYQEAQKIWESLEPYEHAELIRVARREPPSGEGVPPLVTKGILKKNAAHEWRIFAPLFEFFVRAQTTDASESDQADTARIHASSAPPLHITFNPALGHVRVNERSVLLSPVEAELFGHLFRHCERACDANELVNVLMSVESGSNPYGRLHMHLMRLSERLNRDGETVLLAHADSLWQVPCGEKHE